MSGRECVSLWVTIHGILRPPPLVAPTSRFALNRIERRLPGLGDLLVVAIGETWVELATSGDAKKRKSLLLPFSTYRAPEARNILVVPQNRRYRLSDLKDERGAKCACLHMRS